METLPRTRSKPDAPPEPQLGLFAPADLTAEDAVAPAPPIPVAPVRQPRPAARERFKGAPAWAASRTAPAAELWKAPEVKPEVQEEDGDEDEEPAVPVRQVWRVGTLVSEVRSHLESAYGDVWVEGEISNLRAAASGHVYFTLKDGEAQLPAVLFRRQAQLLRFRLEDGLHVLLRGRVSVYEQRGQMQLIGEYVEPVGVGSLQVAFEQLKARLEAEGLFDAARKRPLPLFPRCIGIVTSPAGAVIRDFLTVAGRRHAALEVLIYPAVVQGDAAAAEVSAGIAWFNKRSRSGRVDVIVIARGGGSLEDLAPFNSELLARSIAASELPVVSAVGHETDFSIADFVADLRAPTPSAAAEIITEAQYTAGAAVRALAERLERAGRYRAMMARQRFTAASIEVALGRLRAGLNRREQRLDEQRFRLEALLNARLRQASDCLQQVAARLARQDAVHRLQVGRERWAANESRLLITFARRIESEQQRADTLTRQLAALSPLAVLGRGYALVFKQEGALVKDAADVAQGEPLQVRLARGRVRATVIETSPEPEAG